MIDLVVNTDGASRGNPGNASYGYVIVERNGAILHQEGKTLGVTTNNVAEYTAVLAALTYIKNRWGNEGVVVEVRADSRLVVEQLSGRFKIKSEHLRVIYDQIKRLMEELKEIRFTHVPRAQNFIADRLANQALDRELR